MIYNIDVRVEVPVRDTEVISRVGDTVENIFPGVELDREPGQPAGEAHELERFPKHLHEQTTLDTAHREFARRRDDDGFLFALKKQAAFKGVVNFSVSNPNELGDTKVHVIVRDPSVDEVTNYIAPSTEEEQLVDPNDR